MGAWNMKFYRYLYVGDTVKNPNKIKRRLKHHAGVQVFVISLAPGSEQLEIFHGEYLKQRYYRHHPPVIVGIASDHGEALKLVQQMVQECVEETGGCDLKGYLKQRVRQRARKGGASSDNGAEE